MFPVWMAWQPRVAYCIYSWNFQQITAKLKESSAQRLPFANGGWRRLDELGWVSERSVEEARNTKHRVLHDFSYTASGVRKAGTSARKNDDIMQKMVISGDQKARVGIPLPRCRGLGLPPFTPPKSGGTTLGCQFLAAQCAMCIEF